MTWGDDDHGFGSLQGVGMLVTVRFTLGVLNDSLTLLRCRGRDSLVVRELASYQCGPVC